MVTTHTSRLAHSGKNNSLRRQKIFYNENLLRQSGIYFHNDDRPLKRKYIVFLNRIPGDADNCYATIRAENNLEKMLHQYRTFIKTTIIDYPYLRPK